MKSLRIISKNNPDWNGEWYRPNVEDEMTEVEIPIETENSWIDYILSRVFEEEDIDPVALRKVLLWSTNGWLCQLEFANNTIIKAW